MTKIPYSAPRMTYQEARELARDIWRKKNVEKLKRSKFTLHIVRNAEQSKQRSSKMKGRISNVHQCRR